MQSRISIFLVLAILVTSLILMNSTKEPPPQVTIQDLMEKEIDKKLQRYIDIRNKKCNDRILEDASERADSIIIAKAKSMKVIQDTINRPLVPIRPDRPELLEPIDSSFPSPLLNSDSMKLEEEIKEEDQ